MQIQVLKAIIEAIAAMNDIPFFVSY